MQKQLRSMGGNLDFDQGFADGRIRYVQNGSIRDSLDWNHNLRLAAQSHDWLHMRLEHRITEAREHVRKTSERRWSFRSANALYLMLGGRYRHSGETEAATFEHKKIDWQ
ncbi:MAG: hypothetical protein SGI77_27725 [Pirellulaceae bacterium]|nr:hypothetical protein [Pirellulaceae bacterium]